MSVIDALPVVKTCSGETANELFLFGTCFCVLCRFHEVQRTSHLPRFMFFENTANSGYRWRKLKPDQVQPS